LAAIATGYQQRRIQEAAYRYQREVEADERIVVGVNRYADDEAAGPPIQRIDPDAERAQVEGLRRIRANRDPAAWEAALAAVEDAARNGANVMPALIEAVKADATLGEISDRLRAAFGEHRELITV
jgi:methylmalonyl-CoA mutase N-terminal domain/subunit